MAQRPVAVIMPVFLLVMFSYIVACAALWWHFPQYRFDFAVIVKYWHAVFANFAAIRQDMANITDYVPYSVFVTSIVPLFLLFVVVLKGFGINSRNEYGSAKWASIFDIKDMGLLAKEGIILGSINFFGTRLYLRTKEPLSVLLLAPPGTGKTSGIIIPNLLHVEHSVIIYDLKGELYDVTHEKRQEFGRVLLFDPVDIASVRFNVFAKNVLPAEKSEISAFVKNVVNVFVTADTRHIDDFFIREARVVMAFIAEYLIWKNGWTSFVDTRRFLLDSSFERKLNTMVKEEKLPESFYQRANGILVNSASDRQWAGILAVLRQSLDVFDDDMVRTICDGENSDFAPFLFREVPVSLYIKVRIKDMERLSPLVKSVITAINHILLSYLPKDGDQQITMVMDEFLRLGKFDSLAELPAVSRGYNINTILVAQDYGQIEKTYDRQYVSILETNCAYKIIMQQNNFATAEAISKLIGNETTKRRSMSKTRSGKALFASSSSDTHSFEGKALVSAQYILNMPLGDSLVIVQGHIKRPILSYIPYYFKT